MTKKSFARGEIPTIPEMGLLPGHPQGAGRPWWWDDLTFYAPFENPASPLTLWKGTGVLASTRAHDATHVATYLHPGTRLITAAVADQLRIEDGGALIEGARTNLCLQSEDMATTWAPTTMTIAPNDAVSPDGNTTADLLTASAGNGTLIQDLGVIASASKTFSIYLKRKTGTGDIDLTLNGGTGWTTVAVTTTWTRFTLTASLANPDVGIRIVTDADAVWAWGAQMEDTASFASSYIPTVAGAMVRNADRLQFAVSGNISGTVGSVAAVYKTIADAGATSQYLLDLNNARPVLFVNGADEKASINDGANTLSFATADTHGTAYRVASRWDSGDSVMRIVRSGGTVASAAFDGDMNAGVNATIGDSGTTGSLLWGHIRNLRIWNRALTNAELIAITS